MTEYAIKIRKAKPSEVGKLALIAAYSERVAYWQQDGIQSCMHGGFLDSSLHLLQETFSRHTKSRQSCTGTWVAEHRRRIVGFVTIQREDSVSAEIDNMFVEPAYWGSNVAPDLFHKAESIFRKNNIRYGFLRAISNLRAHMFYKKMGWNYARGSNENDDVATFERRYART